MSIKIWKQGQEPQEIQWPAFKEALNKASFHYADDRGGEWGLAKDEVGKAAKIAIDADWPFWALQRMFAEFEWLVTFDDFMTQFIKILKNTIDELVDIAKEM